MNEIDKAFKEYCKELNFAVDALATLIEFQKSDSEELINIIKEQENG